MSAAARANLIKMRKWKTSCDTIAKALAQLINKFQVAAIHNR